MFLFVYEFYRFTRMKNSRSTWFFVSSFIVLLSLCLAGRKLSGELNPNSTNSDVCTSSVNLVYVKAEGSSDTIHYLWSSRGSFSIIVAQTSKDTFLKVDWSLLCSTTNPTGAITFSETPILQKSILITQLYEFFDDGDNADINDSDNKNFTIHNFSDFTWNVPEITYNASDEITYTYSIDAKTLKLKLTAYGFEDRPSDLPHLLHTVDSMQMELTMDNYTTLFTDKTRFGFEMSMVEDDSSGKVDLTGEKSLDDEYTPGVFHIIYLQESGNQNNFYLEWKPVAYTDSDQTTEKSTAVTETYTGSPITPSDTLSAEQFDSLVPYIFENVSNLRIYSFNLTIGQSKDKYYQDNRYYTWTSSIGIGTAPLDEYSILVIMVIIIGFGIPVLCVIIGSGYMVYRRISKKDGTDISKGIN